MNELTKNLKNIMLPKAAIIAYKSEEHTFGNDNYHLELYPIDDNGRMGAAIPLSHEFMYEISQNYSEEMMGTPSGKIPPELLFCDTRIGHNKYIWYTPPCRKSMFFSKSLNIEDGEFNVPGTLYIATEEKLNVFAFKGNKPKENDELYYAPYFNVTDGNVCLGNSQLEKPQNPTFKELLLYWEKLFWMSIFTHLGGQKNPTKNNLVIVTENSRTNPFDYNELIKTGKKIKDILL